MASASNAEPSWSDDELADDVATISYEQALRTHGRGRSAVSDAAAVPKRPQPDSSTLAEADTCNSQASSSAPSPKSASITVRLSEPECAQVRRRAAEAGLTVSAYLRSCTLEVESLRKQVKDTLAELRSSSSETLKPGRKAATSRSITDIWRRFWPSGRSHQAEIRLNPANPFAPLHYSHH